MSLKNTVNLGLMGIISLIISHILLTFYRLDIIKNNLIYICIFSLFSLLCSFFSIYSCFKYTKNNEYICKINLIGTFMLMPIIAFNFLALIYEIVPNLPYLNTYSIMYNISSIIYIVLKFVFLFSIYLNKNTNELKKPIYKVFFILTALTSILLIIKNLHFITFNIPNSHILLFQLEEINILYTINLLLLLFTYKGFINELALIGKLDSYSKTLLPLNKKVFGN